MAENLFLTDLHFHTRHSDGSEDVAGAIAEAKTRGVKVLALTDHNNGAGVPEFTRLCGDADIHCLEGVEIYAAFPLDEDWAWDPKFCGPMPHMVILGHELQWDYFRKEYQLPLMTYWQETWLPETLRKLREAKFNVPDLSKDDIAGQLKDFGVPRVLHDIPKDPTNWPRLLEIANSYDPAVTMADIEKSPVRLANRYVYAIGMAGYVLRGSENFTVEAAKILAAEMGGLLIAAHPGGEYGNWSDEHLQYFVDVGGDGLEVWQYYHGERQIRKFLEFAVRHGLAVSGGSDWHGKNGRQTLGCWDKPDVQCPDWVYNEL